MRRIPAVLAALLVWVPAYAEGWSTYVEWHQWTIRSNEYLNVGQKHTSYPLTYLVDGDPRTAWVFSGTQASVKMSEMSDGRPYY